MGLLVLLIPLVYALALTCGIGLLLCVAYKPELGILLIVICVCSVLSAEQLPIISIGVGSLHIPDILLLFMFCLAVKRRIFDRKVTAVTSFLEKPLALFLLVGILSAFASIMSFGLDFNNVVRILRSISYYLIVFIITSLIVTKKQIKFLVTGLFFIAAAVALVMLMQTIVGESVPLISETLIEQAGDFNALRLRPPGQTLLFVSLVEAICFSVFLVDKPLLLSRYFYFVMIICIGVMLTFTRSYLVAFVFILGFFVYLSKPDDRNRLMALMAWCAAFILLFIVILGGSGKFENTFNAISQRYLTLFEGKELLQSSSLSDRYLENFYAIEQIKKNPIFGNGLGNEYRPFLYGSEDELTYYVHNVYLWLIKDFGILGFTFFMWFYVGFLIRAMKNLDRPEDSFLKSVATGSMLAGIGMLPMAFVIPLFMEWHSIVVIAIFIGLSETIIINTNFQVEN
jgi:O-antigen ligase